MKQILFVLFLVSTLSIASYAQDDWHTYPVRSIPDIIKMNSSDMSTKADLIISANPFPSKTKVIYTGEKRVIGKYTKDFIKLWVQTRNVPVENADMLVEEYLFKEQNIEYWIPVVKTLEPFLRKELKAGDEIIIYYFFLGGYDEKRLMEKDTSLNREKPEKEMTNKSKSEVAEKDKTTEQQSKSRIQWTFAVEEFQK